MANIVDINEPWRDHDGLEVETFLKNQITALLSSLGGKFGAVARIGTDLVFYDQENGNILGTVSLSGQNYAININCNLSQVFYVLADETTKMMTISPTTSVSSFGSETAEDYPESYNYVVAVNNGTGYQNKVSGNIGIHGSATFDIRPYLATGDNYVRVTVTGQQSNQTRSMVFTGILTTLTMSCNHTWQNVWNQGQGYVINGIRFAGSVVKTLHVSVNNVECDPVVYNANQSYTTTATYYTIPASAFPGNSNSVCSVKLWMTAEGVSTPVISFNIMCVAESDDTPMVAINQIVPVAYNYTSGTLFGYAVYNANKVLIDMSATLNSVVYNIASGVPITDREAGNQYAFAYSLEVDTGSNDTKIGSLSVAATAYRNDTIGVVSTAGTVFDNTYSYLATPGALFYMNAATRDNGASNKESIINEMGASQDGNFAASYPAVWSGLSWYNDGWSADSGSRRALVIPAGCSCSVTGLAPLSLLSSYQNGITIELLIQNGSPSDYSVPLLTIQSTVGNLPCGLFIYPTKIVMFGQSERDEDFQSVNIAENRITHICITMVKSYEMQSGKNVCSVYINGISNVSFAFDGSSSFGTGNLVIGQPDTDVYLYKMRVYGSALEAQAVFNNFLNCVFDGVEFTRTALVAENDVLDGDNVDYYKVKAAGYNIMVVTTPNNEPIPMYFNQIKVKHTTVRFEYAEDSHKNVTVSEVDMDGQGTTSKKYYRWNLRWKTTDSTTWIYGDGTSDVNKKKGHFIKDDIHPLVDRITAKKNIASSPQGHKMGLTGLYNDLFHAINSVAAGLPDQDYQVAVFQFPFVGFQFNTTNNSYEFIGIYTAGPDKGSKVTFGYDKTAHPYCLSIEGPNHAPRGTRFLTPWIDVEYDPQEETLNINGNEAWDCDYVKWETSSEGTQTDWDNILALYESEWRPAYNCVYDNSPYLASYQEVISGLNNPNITTLADLLTVQNATAVKAGTTNGMRVKNEFIAFYDSSYNLYYYRVSAGRYVALDNQYSGYANALDGLTSYLSALGYGTSSPTTAQLIEARAARFKATMESFFDLPQTLYHYCFCLLYGVTDNFAKNMYPQKFLRLTDSGAGNRWGWRQDDLDSVLATDNNGSNTKKYSVEHLDTFDNVQIFQGGDSALWVLIKDYYEAETRDMMTNIANAANSIATGMGIQGSGLHESLFNLTSYYCWEHSAKYFPATIYEKDRRWSYIEPWLLAGQTIPGTGEQYPALYNGVAPLRQALGDQYQGERLWMERRIAYMFSKYRIGAFTGTNTGYNAIVFTLATGFEFTLTPAIDLYPVVSLVSLDAQAGRTPAGTQAVVSIGASGDSNNSIHGGDWLANLGDLHMMRLASRGGTSSIDFFIVAARLQVLKIGNATPWNVEAEGFNATAFGVTSPTLTELDARNTSSIRNNIDLLGCPRLRTCLFAGSGASGLLLPVGAKLTEVSFPSGATTVFMHSLTFLTLAGLTLPALAGITTLYINNCANINPLTIAENIIQTVGEQLAYATLIWNSIVTGNVDTILSLSERSGEVVFDGNSVTTHGGKPHVEGTVQVSAMYADNLDELDIISEETYQTNLKKALSGLFGTNLYIIYDPNAMYIRFADPDVETLCATNWGSDGHITTAQAAAATITANSFINNTDIDSFDEFKYFTGITTAFSGNRTTATGFSGCTNLTSITLPNSITALGGSRNNAYGVFGNCSSLTRINIPPSLKQLGGGNNYMYVFTGCTSIERVDISSLNDYLGVTFMGVASHPFYVSDASERGIYLNGTLITTISIPPTVTEVKNYLFYRVNTLTSVTFPNTVTSIGQQSFYGCSGLTGTVTIPSSVTSIASGCFSGCHALKNLIVNTTLATTTQMYAGSSHDLSVGDGTGTFHCVGDLSNSSNYFSCFRKYIIGGNYSITSAGGGGWRVKVTDGSWPTEIFVIKGNYSTIGNNQGLSRPIAPETNATSHWAFLEIMGTITSNYCILVNDSNNIIDGFILHLGYDAYTNGVVPCTPDIAGAGHSRISKIYVGKGQSASEDNNILSVYTNDTNWSAYTSKLDTWYNYVNSPDANPDFIN